MTEITVKGLYGDRRAIDLADYVKIPNSNTLISKEKYDSDNDWRTTNFMLAEDGLYMPSPAIFMPYFLSVIEAKKSKLRLHDGNGSPLTKNEVSHLSWILRDACEIYLDAYFKRGLELNGLTIETNHRFTSRTKNKKSQFMGEIMQLESCITRTGYVDLVLNNQGMPIKESRHKSFKLFNNLYFVKPCPNRVCVFKGDLLEGMVLDCDNELEGIPGIQTFACFDEVTKI